MKISSIIERGMDGLAVDIECHLSAGLPTMVIIGFANKAVEEARERLRGAFISSRLPLPRKRIILNLAPGDIPKGGTGFDLAMAIAILVANGDLPHPSSQQLFIGELGLDGSVRAVRGIIGKLLAGHQLGFTSFFIPADNLAQASLVPEIKLYPVDSLASLYASLRYPDQPVPVVSLPPSTTPIIGGQADFSEVAGQTRAKRALEVAATGGHNILLSGPPGTGKTMLARALPSILPPLNHQERLQVTQLHSLASPQFNQIINWRPFRSPHHSASDAALIGGGNPPRPGEISLSHRGVLFLDELPEFRRATIEALRQPLEDHAISVARAGENIKFPADFMLVATANPCPCGYYGSTQANQQCSCTVSRLRDYGQRLSGPIMDRIDMYIEAEPIEHQQLLQTAQTESSQVIARRVAQARRPQLNGRLNNHQLKQICQLQPAAQKYFNAQANGVGLSARGYLKTLRVARTIADLAGSPDIQTNHLAEALQYRQRPINQLIPTV